MDAGAVLLAIPVHQAMREAIAQCRGHLIMAEFPKGQNEVRTKADARFVVKAFGEGARLDAAAAHPRANWARVSASSTAASRVSAEVGANRADRE